MFFVFSKILNYFFLPIIWVFGLLLAGLLVKRQPLKKRLLISAAVVLYFFSNDFIIDRIMAGWEIPAVMQSDIKGKYDVAIVLGGYTEFDPSLDRVQFESGGDRLFQALELYKKGYVRKIMLDGGSGSLVGTNVEAPHLQAYLHKIGIPDSDVIIEPRSRNTHENAIFAKPLLDSIAPHGKYLLVTSGYHMRRSLACFKKASIELLPYTTDRVSGPVKLEFDYLFIPSLDALYHWEVLLHEWIGMISYKTAGYI